MDFKQKQWAGSDNEAKNFRRNVKGSIILLQQAQNLEMLLSDWDHAAWLL